MIVIEIQVFDLECYIGVSHEDWLSCILDVSSDEIVQHGCDLLSDLDGYVFCRCTEEQADGVSKSDGMV